MTEQSKTCPEQRRRVQNRKFKIVRDYAEYTGAGGQGDQVKKGNRPFDVAQGRLPALGESKSDKWIDTEKKT
jgi:hypothetical protein